MRNQDLAEWKVERMTSTYMLKLPRIKAGVVLEGMMVRNELIAR